MKFVNKDNVTKTLPCYTCLHFYHFTSTKYENYDEYCNLTYHIVMTWKLTGF